MINYAYVLGLVLSLIMGFTPIFVLRRAKKLQVEIPRNRKNFTTHFLLTPLYCIAGIVFAFVAGSGLTAIASVLLFHAWSVAGPLVAIELSAFARTLNTRNCYQCGYNLTGNTSGRCPECGLTISADTTYSPPLAKRLTMIPWKTHFFRYIAAVLLLVVLFGYRPYVRGFICTNCAENKCWFQHRFFIPYTQFELFSFAGKDAPRWQRSFGLTPFLDPQSKCTHNWLTYVEVAKYGLYGRRFLVRDNPANNHVATESDFPLFLKDNPKTLDRIRADLEVGNHIDKWLTEEYNTWKDR